MTKGIFWRQAMALALSLALAAEPGALLAADAGPERASLEAIQVGADQVRLSLSRTPKYNTFVTANPPRLVLEMLNTEFNLDDSEKVLVGKGRYLKKVRSGQFAGEPNPIARIVLDLKEAAPYRVEPAKDGLLIRVEAAVASQSDSNASLPALPGVQPNAAPASAPAAAAAPKGPFQAAAELTPEEKAFLNEAAAQPKAAAPPQASAPAAAQVPSPAAAAALQPKPGIADENLSADAELNEMVQETRREPAPQAKPELVSRTLGRNIMATLSREPISLDLENTDIRDALKMMAAKANINMVYGPQVSGPVNLHLEKVPFAEAFNILLSLNKLVASQVGENILWISTLDAIKSQRSSTIGMTRVFRINYRAATDLKTQLDAIRTAEGRTGTTTVDEKNNTLIVTESPEGLAAVERFLAEVDTRPRQVLIEAKLVEVKLSKDLALGIQWDYLNIDRARQFGQTGVNTVGAVPALVAAPPSQPFDRQTVNLPAQPVGAGGRGTGVILPADKVFGAFTFGRITNNYMLSATLTAAASAGKVKVLSDPKVATLNGQQATINITTQTPYVTSNVAATGVATQSVAYVTTGIQLQVKPTINADGRVTLNINPRVSQPSATAASQSATGAIAVDTREAQTNIMVKDGETIVIGGLITDSISNTEAKVPLLGDIPIIGWLFKKKTVIRSRVELLIFVTTRILAD